MRKLGLYFAAVCIPVSLLVLMPSSQGQGATHGIAGTWIVMVTVNTPPGAPPFVFTDLIAFNEGGTLTATSTAFNPHTSEILPGPLGVDTSDGYGVWEPGTGPNEVRITFKRFLFAGANASSAALYS